MNNPIIKNIIIIITLLLPLGFVYFDSNNIDKNITIAAGGTGGAYYQTALDYKKELEKLQIEVRSTDGINPRHMDEFYSLQSHIVMVKEEILICMQIEFKKNN